MRKMMIYLTMNNLIDQIKACIITKKVLSHSLGSIVYCEGFSKKLISLSFLHFVVPTHSSSTASALLFLYWAISSSTSGLCGLVLIGQLIVSCNTRVFQILKKNYFFLIFSEFIFNLLSCFQGLLPLIWLLTEIWRLYLLLLSFPQVHPAASPCDIDKTKFGITSCTLSN